MPVLPAQSRQALRAFVGCPRSGGKRKKGRMEGLLLWERCSLQDSPPHPQPDNKWHSRTDLCPGFQMFTKAANISLSTWTSCDSICSGLDLALPALETLAKPPLGAERGPLAHGSTPTPTGTYGHNFFWLSEAPTLAPFNFGLSAVSPTTGTVPNMQSLHQGILSTNSGTVEAAGLPPEERTLDQRKALYLRTQD